MNNVIYPCLWFNGNARQAADLYCSAFQSSKIIADSEIVVSFESSGQKFMCLNGGPGFVINPSISFFVVCETEAEVDDIWQKLLDGGSVLMPLDRYEWSSRYGWLQDKFGVSWQLSFGNREDTGQKFTPFLMFTGTRAGKAEEAIGFYTSLFENSGIRGIERHEKGGPEVEGTVKHGQFNLGKYVFMAMDSSLPHQFGFNEAVSLVVECSNQEEIDYYWDRLTRGGEESQCGWLKDKYGVWWQIIPSILETLMSDPSRSERVVKAFLQMKKFDIETLLKA